MKGRRTETQGKRRKRWRELGTVCTKEGGGGIGAHPKVVDKANAGGNRKQA